MSNPVLFPHLFKVCKRNDMKLADRIERMEESKTILMARLTRELRAQGKDVITLSLGDLDFNTPDYIKQAAHKAIDDNYSHYPPVEGYTDLLDAIIEKFYHQTGFRYNHKNILVSNGAKHTLANVILALINPGDEVILPVPYWVTYNELINLAGGEQVYLRTGLEQDFKITAQQLEQAITERTKLIMLNNPGNPTGAVYSREELEQIAQVIARHKNVMVISDEVYDELVFDGEFVSLGVFPDIRDQLILVNGVSKTYAMTGWRVGFMAAPEWLTAACKKLQGQMTSGVNAIAQKAAAAALAGGEEIIKQRREMLRRRRDVIVQLLHKIEGVKFMPTRGSFYIFPDFSSYLGRSNGDKIIETTTDLALYLLETANVALVAGEAFGAQGFMRLSFAVDEDIIVKAMARVREALERL